MYRRISIVSHPQHTQCNSFLIIHFAVFMTQFRNMTLDHTAREQKCSSCRKLLLFYPCSNCYCFRDTRGIVFVACGIVLSKGCKPCETLRELLHHPKRGTNFRKWMWTMWIDFMPDLERLNVIVVFVLVELFCLTQCNIVLVFLFGF